MGLVRSAGQSMFNQGPARPPAQQPSPATLSLQTPNSNYNQTVVQRANSAGGGVGPIPKSSSWNEDILTSTPKPHSAAPLRHTSPPPSIASSEVSGAASVATRKKLQYKTRSQTDSLIELIPEGDAANTTTVSILHDFDPLNESDNEEEEEIYWSSQKSNFSESFYDTNDPFSYME